MKPNLPDALRFGAALLAALSLLPAINAQAVSPATGNQTDTNKAIVMEAFVTTGSNIKRLDQENTLPVTVFSMSELQTRDSATSMDLLIGIPEITNIPNNESSLNAVAARGDNANAALRGLGVQNTLVLLNGRRAPMEPFNTSSVNVNTLPTTGLQQLEVLRDGASSIYGSDAVAGVINYVTDKKPHGGTISQRFGTTQHGGGMDYKLDINYGNMFADGKGSYVFQYSGYARQKIMYGQRDFSRPVDRSASARAPWNVIGSNYDGLSQVGIWPQFILGQSTSNTGTLAFYPKSGVPTDLPTINAYSSTNLIPRSLLVNYNLFSVGQPRTDRNTVFGHVEYDLTPSITFFAEGNFYLSHSDLGRQPMTLSASDSRVFVGVDNPFNPYGSRFYSTTGAPNADGTARVTGTPQPLTIAAMLLWDDGNEQIKTLDSETRILTGLRGKLGTSSWNWEMGLMAGTVYVYDEAKNEMMDSWTRAAALRTDATAWNPFPYTFKVAGGAVVADKPYVNPQSVMNTMRRSANRFGHSKIASFDFRLTGSVMNLWAGPIQASTGVEWRYEFKEDHKDQFAGVNGNAIGGDGVPLDPNNNDMIVMSPKFPYSAGREITSGYVETQIPLAAAKNNIPFAKNASLNAAVRTEHYSDFGYTTKPKFGGDWRPTSWLMVRGSLNQGFRAPDLADLYQPASFSVSTPPGVKDPARNNFFTLGGIPGGDASVLAQNYTLANPLLKPETSTGRSVGIVLEIPQVKGLSFTVDYWELEQKNLMVSVGSSAGLDEALLLAYTQAGLAAGKSITSIDVGYHSTPLGTNTYKGDPAILRNPVNATDIATFQLAYAKVPQAQWLAPLGVAVGSIAQTQNTSGRNFTNGMDFSVRYDLPKTPLGQFRVSTEWSEFLNKYNKLKPNFGKNDDIIQMIIPKWKSSATIQWRNGPWDAGLNAAYQTAFRTGASTTAAVYNSLGAPSYIKAFTSVSSGGVPTIVYYEKGKDQLQVNSSLSYRFGPEASKWLRRTSIRFGVNNLFDANPAPANVNGIGFTAGSGQSLWVGRAFTLTMSRDF